MMNPTPPSPPPPPPPILLSVRAESPDPIWRFVRRYPGITILGAILLCLAVIPTMVWWYQSSVEKRESDRFRQEQEHQKLMALTGKFARDDREGAILSLGSLNHPKTNIKLLANLLAIETEPTRIEAIGQALVSAGPEAMPELRQLNQALKTDLDALGFGNNAAMQQAMTLKLMASQRSIAKLLRLYSPGISGINLGGTDLGQTGGGQFTLVLEKLPLAGVQLRLARLTKARLAFSQFSGAGADGRWNTGDDQIGDLTGADLTEADLRGTFLNLSMAAETNFTRANLNQANLFGARLQTANFSSTQLVGADLRSANLNNANFIGANLGEAKLDRADLTNASLNQTIAESASFSGANLANASAIGASLVMANFPQANLEGANLSSADLSNANLDGARLQNGNWRQTNLTGASMRGAVVHNADFEGVVFVPPQPKATDGFIQKTAPTGATGLFQGTDFALVRNLDPKQIAFICAQGGLHPSCPPTTQISPSPTDVSPQSPGTKKSSGAN
ncbi:MAG TPA: pentapeptide repeat-containing protein [Oscillatoriaceae cyanobacterium M33_DOE_052]|uniref:Pentapeptide repeat-containing protein n=1 Tax=Planktothricoides sp. SpSt-374 TaxID=2282167 RepID=A0A7C3VMV0_9CYAN|nr:pentapeptide repeat-containing protein [Oscillatoriaceae cyanobacterium M33_DOE_052]